MTMALVEHCGQGKCFYQLIYERLAYIFNLLSSGKKSKEKARKGVGPIRAAMQEQNYPLGCRTE